MTMLIYQGRAGDRNSRATAGSMLLGTALAQRFALPSEVIGRTQPPLHLAWDGELAAARDELLQLANGIERHLADQRRPLAVIGRCAAGLATLPVVMRQRPGACVVWFDAHADSNTPTSTPNPYLGGMVLSGAAGLWESGLGRGLQLSDVVLVGARDIDPDEHELIAAGAPAWVKVGADLPARLVEKIGSRPVYVHLDCDVLEPGIVPTEYLSPGGLSLPELHAAFEVLARQEVVGLEVAEFEATWPNDATPVSPDALVDALAPLVQVLCKAP